MKQPVAGYSNLYKDTETGVIVNRETVERQRYRIAKQQAMMNVDAQYQIHAIKQEINELKELIKQMVNK